MTTFVTLDTAADLGVDKPLLSSHQIAMYENPIAIAEGDPTAPSINPAALFLGGKGGDGNFNDAAALSGLGFFEFLDMEITAAKNIPAVSIIRIAGDASLSDVLTVATLSATYATAQAQRRAAELLLRAVSGESRSNGGCCIGVSSGGTGISIASLRNAWAALRPLIGGDGNNAAAGFETPGGGALILLIEGDFDCTGGTINANGYNGTGSGAHGSGGGSILVICTGEIINGTFNAKGGNGLGAGDGGGGGMIQLVATSYSGTQTMSASGGTGSPSATAGYTDKATLTRDQIRTMLQRL